MTSTRRGPSEWGPAELQRALLSPGESPLFVLDVRNREEYEAWKIEGRFGPETLNAPYFEILERGGKDDMVDSVAAFVESELSAKLPREGTVLAVCAKGGTSEYVAEGLRRSGYSAANLSGGTKAWADYHEAKVVVDGPTQVLQLSRPARGCLSYLAVGGDGNATAIDPLRDPSPMNILLTERGLTLERVIDTHAHADHISGGPALAKERGAPYYLHPFDAVHPFDLVPGDLEFLNLCDQMSIRIGESRLEVMHVPGHTLGNCALLLDGQVLFSGDTIFVASISRPDLGGRAEAWARLHYRSVRRLSELPDETLVLPGHFASYRELDAQGAARAKLGDLKQGNPGVALALGSEEEFVNGILDGLNAIPESYVEIKRVNAGLAQAHDERASELEIGKNECALA